MNQEHLTANLNPAQKQAVTEKPGHLRVIAGAGSGKTRVLVHKIAWINTVFKVPSHNILAVTFTNKAAKSIQNRVDELLKEQSQGMWLGTFHSICHRLLRLYSIDFSIPSHFQVIDQDDQLRLIKQIQKEMNLDDKAFPAKKTQYYISSQKEQGLRASTPVQYEYSHLEKIHQVYSTYEKACHECNLVDFDELILKVVESIQTNTELKNKLQNKFKYILIDEFQDTNKLQYQLICQLAGEENFVTVVGDDDQSIYSWRGAQVENILNFSKNFPDVETIRLEQNYRSTDTILQASNAVISNNQNRLNKTLWTQSEKGEKIKLFSAFNEYEEARFIVESIQKNIHSEIPLEQQAILYRSNAQSRVLEEQLTRANIPYIIYGGLRFFDRAEIKDSLAYMRLVINPHDNISLERIINTPHRGIGQSTLEKLRKISIENTCSLWDAAVLSTQQENQGLPTRSQKPIIEFIQLIENIRKEALNNTFSTWFEIILQNSGLIQHQQKSAPEQAKNKLENLQELSNAIGQFEINNSNENTLLMSASFIADVTLDNRNPNEKQKTNDKCIQLMTLHSAKGLEFKNVFISGMEEGLFPHKMAIQDGRELEEERRLCYVGITRAKESLCISYAQSRRLYNQESFQRPSRFLAEIPKELITEISSTNQEGTFYEKKIEQRSSYNNLQHSKWKLGQNIKHHKFGYGIILNFEGDGENTRIQIRFENHGVKWLIQEYAKIENV